MYRSLTALLAAVLLLAGASSAEAAVTRSFDIYTAFGPTGGGQAHTWGTATFRSGGRATVSGRLNDVCPKDGLGAYLTVTFDFHEGGGGPRSFTAKDAGGCEDPDGIAYTFGVNGTTAVARIILHLQEIDADGSRYGEDRTLFIFP